MSYFHNDDATALKSYQVVLVSFLLFVCTLLVILYLQET